MKTIMKNLTGALLIAAAALGTAQPQSARELSLSDIRAQWPQETLFASALCQRALEDPGEGWINQQYKVDPKTFVPDLNTLMEKSDEVILAGPLDHAAVLSPSGKSVATYTQVRIIRSWKGPHHAGDTLVYRVPVGTLYCEPSQQGIFTRRFEVNGPITSNGPTLFVLFLRQSKGDEKLVQGLSPAAGEGVQGIFQIQLPGFPAVPRIDSEDYCIGGGNGNVNVKHCDTIVQTNQSPVMADPWIGDPLAKKYNGMPASDFLREVQSAAAQGLAEESSPR